MISSDVEDKTSSIEEETKDNIKLEASAFLLILILWEWILGMCDKKLGF